MFRGQDIQALIELLERRNVKLHHACQLKDFQSYLALGGIPSRQLLEDAGYPFTHFSTDNNDKANGDWDKVFANFSDFGSFFGKGNIAVPNVYGPILLLLEPRVLTEAVDVAIYLQSAGSQGFSRERASLSAISDIERLFKGPEGKPWVKNTGELQQEFSLPEKPPNPELSCTVESGKLSLDHVDLIRVDPYVLNGRSLHEFVRDFVIESGWNFQQHRIYLRDRCPTFTNEIAEVLSESNQRTNLLNSLNDEARSQEFRNWLQNVADRENLLYQIKNFSYYLFDGTISVMMNW